MKRSSRIKIWKKSKIAGPSTAEGKPLKEDHNTVYWPTRLLAYDIPNARIHTYGYDSSISRFFDGPANQSTITDNGRALLSSIASQRQHCQGRPLMLIVHSLGGIVVKSVSPPARNIYGRV